MDYHDDGGGVLNLNNVNDQKHSVEYPEPYSVQNHSSTLETGKKPEMNLMIAATMSVYDHYDHYDDDDRP